MLSNETESLCLLETPYFRVCQDAGYYVIKERALINGVVVVPVFEDGTILTLDHFRPAIGTYSTEFPRGSIDADESIFDAALRELKEETGLEGRDPVDIGRVHSNTSLLQSQVAIVKVSVTLPEGGVYALATMQGDGEAKSMSSITPAAFKYLVANGNITDSHTLSAMLLLDC